MPKSIDIQNEGLIPSKTQPGLERKRPTIDEYFIRFAELAATRSTCVRRQVGAVLVRDKHILSTGYNGAPANMEHCTTETCLRLTTGVKPGERHELCRGVHAEQNAIIQCALHGVSSRDATLYVTHSPCTICAKMLINAGIARVIVKCQYPDKDGIEMLQESGIEIDFVEKE
ncbi:MAG: cytidine/deoxycytidylate deaminase family protein [Candidatus Odinarchaeota archaeon]